MQPITLPVRLRALRAAHGWTLEQAAEEVGLNPDNLSKLERGYRKPRVGTLAKIADAYRVAIEELLSLEEEPALVGKDEAPQPGLSVDSEKEVINFDDDAVRAAYRAAKAGKLTKKEAARAIADAVRGGPEDALEDAVERLLEYAERERSEERDAAKT
jgi:transcriptional regulator with XRE-family HTH domain